MEVIVKFKKKDPWSGVVKYKNCYDYIGPYLTRSGFPHTGLTKEDEKRLEKELGYDEGTLDRTSKFWNTFAPRLTNKELVLNTDVPWEELQYLYLKSHKRVAKGLSDKRAGTDYVMIDSESEAKEANKTNKRRRDAIRAFDKMSIEDMRKALRIFGYKSDTMSNELLESKMFSIVEAEPERFFAKWVNNPNRGTEYIIDQAISKNVIRRNKNIYYYGTEIIGSSMDDTIMFLEDKKNQEIKLAVISEIEVKS